MRKLIGLLALLAVSMAFGPAQAQDECVAPPVLATDDSNLPSECEIQVQEDGEYGWLAVSSSDWTITLKVGNKEEVVAEQISVMDGRYPGGEGDEAGTFQAPAGSTIIASVGGGCAGTEPNICGAGGFVGVGRMP